MRNSIPECSPPVRQGIAPALSACSIGTYWGETCRHEDLTDKQWKLLGGEAADRAHHAIASQMKDFDPRVKAREVMQVQLQPAKGCEELPTPECVEEEPPMKPNVFSDGSVKNPRSTHWQIGGVGVWWPDRKIATDPLEKNELRYMASEETDFGVRGWNAFNNLKNSSTRTEIGASLLAMMPRKSTNIGIDSKATIVKGDKLLDHARKRKKTKIREEDGTLLLGGEISPYHRETPWKNVGNYSKMATYGKNSTRQ